MASSYKNPLQYVFSTALIAAGYFIIWLPIFYYLASGKIRKVICTLIWLCGGAALIDYMAFGEVGAFVSPRLRYDKQVAFTVSEIIINLAVIILVVAVMLLKIKKKRQWVKTVYIVIIIGVVSLSAVNIMQTQEKLSDSIYETQNEPKAYEGFSLSKKAGT